jgi:hypothetical protein
MMGKRDAVLDLRTLKGTSHLWGLGALGGLTGEITIADGLSLLARVGTNRSIQVTESYDGDATICVWAEVPSWQTTPVPPDIRTYSELEAALTQGLPFRRDGTAKSDRLTYRRCQARHPPRHGYSSSAHRRSHAITGGCADDQGHRRYRQAARHCRARPHHRRQERACELSNAEADPVNEWRVVRAPALLSPRAIRAPPSCTTARDATIWLF